MDNLGNATRNATRAIGNQANQLSGLKSQIAGVAGAYLGAQTAVKAFNSTVGNAAKFEQQELVTRTMFKDDGKAAEYMKLMEDMALKSAVLNTDDMMVGSKSYVGLTKDLGQLEKMWNITEKLQAFSGVDTKQASFSLKEAFQGDYISIVDAIGIDKKEMQKIVKLNGVDAKITAMNALLDKMGVTDRTLEEMAGSTLGQWSAITEKVGVFSRLIGKTPNTKLGAILKEINVAFDNINTDAFARKVGDALGIGLEKVVDFTKKIWSLRETIASVAKVVGTFGLSVGGIVLVAKTIMGIGAAIAFLASPIGLIAGAITGLVFGFMQLYQRSETVKKVIDGIGSAFKSISHIFTGEHKAAIDVLKSAGFSEEQISLIRKFGYSMKDAFDKLKGIFQSTAHIFTGEHKAAIDVLKSAGFTEDQIETIRSFGYGLKSAFDKVVEIFDGLGTMMMGGGSSDFLAALGLSPEAINNITSFVNTIKTQLGEVIPFIKEKFEQMRPTFEMLQNAFKKVQGVVMEVFPAVWSVLEPILSNIWSSIQRVADVATWAFNNIIVPGLALLSAAFSAVWSIIGPILELIGAAIKLSFEVLKIVWDTIIAPFAENLTGIFAKAVELAIPIVEKIGSVFEKIGGLISAAAGKISNFAETLKSVKVPGWIGKIGSGAASFASNIFGGGKKDGSHYNGIGRIGWDGYIAELHAGERVLNRFEADQYDAVMGGEMQVAGVSDFKHEARSVNNTTINQNTTNSSGIDAKPTQGSTSISIAKLADSIVVREDADVTRIADELVAKILEKRGVTA
ncbi:hypothetical protein [Lysinibacillus tabacifolii]|uniref:Phage tail tape measure protein n=1 Tax=Lysinibacillus tabacifolii TaxID=1173107 RepID=A0ABY2T390_9BACI|nr:hypothetical protein [Lysinibacillus tabacifolii]TKI50292.1 hypothetical protein FC748_03490 [Lysinibacillus tabacifolii]